MELFGRFHVLVAVSGCLVSTSARRYADPRLAPAGPIDRSGDPVSRGAGAEDDVDAEEYHGVQLLQRGVSILHAEHADGGSFDVGVRGGAPRLRVPTWREQPPRPLVLADIDRRNVNATVSTSADSLVDAIQRWARKPVEVMEDGVPLLVAKAKLAGGAFLDAVTVSLPKLILADFKGAWDAMVEAYVQADAKNNALDRATSAGTKKSLGILMVFVVIISIWLLEFILTTNRSTLPPLATLQASSPQSQEGFEPYRFLHALSFFRFCLAWHVVFDTFYHPGVNTSADAGAWILLARWGCLAGPWFFLLSGFSNTYARLMEPPDEKSRAVHFSGGGSRASSVQSGRMSSRGSPGAPGVNESAWTPSPHREEEVAVACAIRPVPPKGNKEDWIFNMLKCVATWYPLYVIALVWCAFREWSFEADDWSHFLSSLLLVNGVVFEGECFPHLLHAWWFSNLMVYLVVFTPMHIVLRVSPNPVYWTVFFIAVFVTIPSSIMEWFFMHHMPVFQVIQYWPTFVFGQALCHWFVRRCMESRPSASEVDAPPVWRMRLPQELPVLARFGATISFIFFGIMFFLFSPYDKLPGINHQVRPLILKGGALPMLAVMVVGLAGEVDPMAKLFARVPFRWGERLAFTTLILQVPVHNTIQDWTGWAGMTWTFAVVLFFASVVAHYGFERPWRRYLNVREK